MAVHVLISDKCQYVLVISKRRIVLTDFKRSDSVLPRDLALNA